MGLLETENKSKHNMELQPWIPFCDGKCTFCYFPVNCDKQNIDLYLEALKKALSFYAKSPYVKSSTFSEFYIGGGSPSVLSKRPNRRNSPILQRNIQLHFQRPPQSLLRVQTILPKRKSDFFLQMQLTN